MSMRDYQLENIQAMFTPHTTNTTNKPNYREMHANRIPAQKKCKASNSRVDLKSQQKRARQYNKVNPVTVRFVTPNPIPDYDEIDARGLYGKAF